MTEQALMTLDLDEVDQRLTSPEFFADPGLHETFDALREQDPVHWTAKHDKHPFWSLTNYADMHEIMTAPELFSSRAGTGVPKGGMPPSPEDREARGFDVDIATMDLPAHRRFRQPLNSHFSSPAATRVQDEIARITAELIAEIGPRGTAEVVGDLGGQLPTRLVFPILGVPEVDWDTLRRLTRMAQHADDEEYQVNAWGSAPSTETCSPLQALELTGQSATVTSRSPRAARGGRSNPWTSCVFRLQVRPGVDTEHLIVVKQLGRCVAATND
jgi:cytochrome P450